MAEIKYVCISDLHFGADNSLLTNLKPGTSEVDPTRPSAVLSQLVACLRGLLSGQRSKPTLILNGDVLELALALDNVAIMAFERFIELLFPPGGALIDEKIVFIPGNHDHHLWETARETQYVHFLQGQPSAGYLEAPWHTTKMFDPDLVDAFLLNSVIHRDPSRSNISVGTVYPNLGFMRDDGTRCVIFTHGHFTEPIYSLMSSLRSFLVPNCLVPTDVWDLEKENFAWIDFFWSTMGRSGEVGKDVEHIYTMLLVPEMRKKLGQHVGEAIARARAPHVPGAGHVFGWVVSSLLDHAGGLERTKQEVALSPEAATGLETYLEGPLHNQFVSDGKTMPANATVVFGHTHKPFVTSRDLKGFPQQTGVFNSGGWVVDTPDSAPTHGGAVIIVDDEYNVASLRVYNESDTPQQYGARVEDVNGAAPNPLRSVLEDHLRTSAQTWTVLSSIIADAVSTYHQNFRKRLETLRQEI